MKMNGCNGVRSMKMVNTEMEAVCPYCNGKKGSNQEIGNFVPKGTESGRGDRSRKFPF